jgi:3-mercaptopyruvate sulfurtransferase SseA
MLKRAGIDHVRPLEGGLDSWRKHLVATASGRVVEVVGE